MIATASMDGTVAVWDLETGTEKASLKVSDPATSIDWDPNYPNVITIAQHGKGASERR